MALFMVSYDLLAGNVYRHLKARLKDRKVEQLAVGGV
jgi:hypothetical protein